MTDMVIDSCVMRLYDQPKDARIRDLFVWLHGEGTLCVSRYLLSEYQRQGNTLVAALIDRLTRRGRFSCIGNAEINSYKRDRHYNYCCNGADRRHARVVFLSARKRLVSFDEKLRQDVNGFSKCDGIKPIAVAHPAPAFYR